MKGGEGEGSGGHEGLNLEAGHPRVCRRGGGGRGWDEGEGGGGGEEVERVAFAPLVLRRAVGAEEEAVGGRRQGVLTL